MGWLSWKDRPRKDRPPEKKPVFGKEIPRDDDRRGPAPPPPRTAHAPGVRVYAFDAIPSQYLLRLDDGYGGFCLEGEEGGRRSAALLVLTGGGAAAGAGAAAGGGAPATSPGDVLIWTAAAFAAQSPPGEGPLSLSIPLEELSRTSPDPRHTIRRDDSLSLEEISRTSPRPHQRMNREGPLPSLAEISRTSPQPQHHIRRDDLGGKAVPGITGLRALARLPESGLAVLRLGPPPGARWVFKGVTAVAVFSGRLAAFDGEDVKVIRAGALARVADPTATLYLEAGNDAALAVALAAEDFVAALG